MSPPFEPGDVAAQAAFADGIEFFERVLRDWIADQEITFACGRWSAGAVSEILPNGGARLLPARYGGCFAGVRELRLDDGPHHRDIDLGRFDAGHLRGCPLRVLCLNAAPRDARTEPAAG